MENKKILYESLKLDLPDGMDYDEFEEEFESFSEVWEDKL